MIIYLITVPCMFTCYKFFGSFFLIVVAADTALQLYFAFVVSICALFIPIAILNVIPSFVQTLYVLWGDDPAAFDRVRPAEANMLKEAAFRCYGYQVVYDDHRITGRC